MRVKASTKAAKQTKAERKAEPVKVVPEVEESAEEEEEQLVAKAKTVKQPAKTVKQPAKTVKKSAKAKKVVKKPKIVEPVEEEEDDDEEQDEAVDDGDLEVSEDDDAEENIEQSADDDDDDDDDEQNDGSEEEENDEDAEDEEENENAEDEGENENAEDDDEDDDQTSPSGIEFGPFLSAKPYQCIHVTKLPRKCKQIDLVEAFAKYGPIQNIHIVTPQVGGIFANIAFKTTKAASAALSDKSVIKVGGYVVAVSKYINKSQQSPANAVYVKCLSDDTTEEDLRETFKSCGEIESIKMIKSKFNQTLSAAVTFVRKESVAEALKLHNLVLKDSNIKVFEEKANKVNRYDENLAVLVRNTQNLKSIDVSKLRSIFAKCGEIEIVDILCKSRILAFISFKTEEAAKKALAMNGKTKNDILLELEPYSRLKKLTTINVTNLPKGCTEEHIRAHFVNAGKILNVYCKKHYATVNFEDTDGYCKSFLYNESVINGNMIFIEPFSKRKAQILQRNKHFTANGFKRTQQNGHGQRGGNPKRPKMK